MCFISQFRATSETLENTEMDEPSRPQNASLKTSSIWLLRLENPRMYQCSRVFAFINFLAIF
jgi:hypothetical protein